MKLPIVKMPNEIPYSLGNVNLGVYLDRSKLKIPKGGLSDCLNVRIKEGRVRAENMGWLKFVTDQMPGQVLMIDNHFTRSGTQTLILACPTDLARYHEGSSSLKFITPTYGTGQAQMTAYDKTVSGTGTAWNANVKAGDFFITGTSSERGVSSAWWEIASVTNDTELELVLEPDAGTILIDYTIRQTYTGDDSDIWDADTFPNEGVAGDDTWFATNGIEMVKWDGSTAEVEPYDPGFVCRSLMHHKNIMLYGWISDGDGIRPGSVRNSAIGLPETVDGTLDSGEWIATDGVDAILEMLPLGDAVGIYCERSVNMATFVGYPIVYAVRTAVPDYGAMSSRSVANRGEYHDFLGNDRGYRFDGVSLMEMGPQVFREVIRALDPSRRMKTLHYIDEENGDIIWVIPKTSDDPDATTNYRAPETAYVAHYLESRDPRDPDPFTIRDMPATAMGFYQRSTTLRFDDLDVNFDTVDFAWNDRQFEAQFPFTLFGDKDGYLYTLGTAGSQDGGAIKSSARFPRMALADGEHKGIVKRIEPYSVRRGSANHTLSVVLWTTDFAEGDPVKAAQLEFDVSHESARYVSPRKAGRYGEVEFVTNGINRAWELSGFGMAIVPGARR